MIYSVGVDGGGSKTECILVGAEGRLLASTTGPGSNPSVTGPAEARQIVAGCLRSLLEPFTAQDPDFTIQTTLLCMAGSRSFWQELAGTLTTFGRVVAVDDSLPVLELATGGAPGLVLHGGTGSFVAARANPEPGPADAERPTAGPFGIVHYGGGLGWRFGDPGSGYDVGRRAIARALLEWQGWLPPSALGAFFREQTGLSDAGALSRLYYNDSAVNPKISHLAPALLDLARTDETVRTLIADSAAELLQLALRMAAKLFPAAPLASLRAGLSGPILTHPVVAASLIGASPLPLPIITDSPAEGVRRLLLRLGNPLRSG